ncbi:hypothetical protein C8F04DRAFT_21996 [Mycena alexandri]|uniref:Uncharacterized protein n=1 Tax=Mycena alexandri TaxID=1745969 RepID=A0AAD6XH15_9AGAR|nr:hypothetical protein C8F04DRAFT_21996 [Mycena alexandri]
MRVAWANRARVNCGQPDKERIQDAAGLSTQVDLQRVHAKLTGNVIVLFFVFGASALFTGRKRARRSRSLVVDGGYLNTTLRESTVVDLIPRCDPSFELGACSGSVWGSVRGGSVLGTKAVCFRLSYVTPCVKHALAWRLRVRLRPSWLPAPERVR